MAHTSEDPVESCPPSGPGRGIRPVFSSARSRVSASGSVDVSVNVKLDTKDANIEAVLPKLQGLVKPPQTEA